PRGGEGVSGLRGPAQLRGVCMVPHRARPPAPVAAPVRGADRAIVPVQATPSTMDAGHALAQGGAPAGTAVVAEEQTAGRGSRGRHRGPPIWGLRVRVVVPPGPTGLAV